MVEHAEQKIQPERVIRLVSPGDTIEVKHYRYGEKTFRSKPIQISDLGNVRLAGLRGHGTPSRLDYSIRFIVQEGSLREITWDEVEQNPNLFEIEVEIEKSISFPPGHILHCRLDIDSIDKSFESRIPPDEDADPEPILAFLWHSTDPNDTRDYKIYASPEDTALLSRFGFSFYTKQMEPEG